MSADAELVGEFTHRLAASLADGTFVRLVLSGARPSAGAPEKVLGRAVELKGQLHLSITSRYATRDEIKNLPIDEVTAWAKAEVQTHFRNALLGTTRGDWQLIQAEGKQARLVRHPAALRSTPERSHDRRHEGILDDSARDWLTGLEVLGVEGRVRPAMAGKHSQINRYLEILSHLAKDAGWGADTGQGQASEPWTIADMGCGKGYLTFGLWHLCRRVWHLPVRILGVECRPELVGKANELAKRIGAEDLHFTFGSIETVELPPLRGLIALHACDTATDHAIRRGVELGAQLIVVAPCCHKQVRPQLGHPEPLRPVLDHGIMEERMAEWVTDGLRALFLEWAGYRTKMFEFVSSEHTPKNLMISAVREGQGFVDSAARARFVELKTFFGVGEHALDSLLEVPPNAG
jgi:SAM-dependent methyltransferase